MKKSVYALRNADGQVVYVGLTVRLPTERLEEHRAFANRGSDWPLHEYLRTGAGVTIETLEEGESVDTERERHWIERFAGEGHPLLNIRHVLDGHKRPEKLGLAEGADREAVDRIGTGPIMDHFAITRQAVSYWRLNGVPRKFRKAFVLLGESLGHDMSDFAADEAA